MSDKLLIFISYGLVRILCITYAYRVILCRVYQEKLAGFKKQLQQLKDGSHPEYNRKLKKLEHGYKERYLAIYM